MSPISATQFFLECHVATEVASQGSGLCFGPSRESQGSSPDIQWLFPPMSQVALALVGLQLCDVTDLPGCPMFVFQPSLTIPDRLSLLALLDGSTCFTVMDNWEVGVHS